MDKKKAVSGLMKFLDESLTSYHAVQNIKEILAGAGFSMLEETQIWEIEKGGAYFTIRNDSSVMAFRIPDCDLTQIKGFHIYAAHADSPAFKVKENPEMEKEDMYVCVNTEKYGGMIMSSWMDRPLTIAGRVCVEQEGAVVSYPVKLKENICVIPNLAIHMNHEINNGVALNAQTDMLPLLTTLHGETEYITLMDLAAEALTNQTGRQYTAKEILGADLFVENSEKAVLAGVDDTLILSARYDDLACVYAGVRAMLESVPGNFIDVLAIFDNEEVGSFTRQGAVSTFLKDTLENIADCLGVSRAVYRTWKAGSFLVSADNAHACHPNQGGKADPVNKPCLNRGIVLKHHGSQRYATDASSAAFVKMICNDCGLPVQTYTNRSDIAGGSTLGNLVMAQVSVAAVDIGLPQLAMHSAYETAGVQDVLDLIAFTKAFFAL